MKQMLTDVLTAFFMVILLPGILQKTVVSGPAPAELPTELKVSSGWRVMVRSGETVTEMDLDDYITCVVLEEMPASFEPEALKAQSVAARTYARKAQVTGGKHGDGSVCVESACCQGYCAPEAYLEAGSSPENLEKVRTAVEETSGLVLTYEGELIEATYFSSSGGRTEDAAAVWGTEYPYLRCVESPGERDYTQTKYFTPEEFSAALGRELTGNPEGWFSVITYTEGGGVAAMTVAGQTYSGTQLRSLLGLSSTAFSVKATQTGISVLAKGYGHRVGMSQYGAEAMAVSGAEYREILAHYYPETKLTALKTETPA